MILDTIAKYASERVEKDKKHKSLEYIKKEALVMEKGGFIFEKALRSSKPAIICEVKKASPSKGIISKDFPYMEIAKQYEKYGASAISVLTEPKWFLGSDEIFKEIRNNVCLPMLRKDFIVDEYQIYQAKIMGADCVLLICAILNKTLLKKFINICNELGISHLVETHNEKEIKMAVEAKARIIGVNNRNLKDFSVDLNNATNLRSNVPKEIIFVAESGIMTTRDGINLVKNGADALLIGEAIMKIENKKEFINKIKEFSYE